MFQITNEFIQKTHEANVAKGWWSNFRSEKTLLTLINTEYTEAFEEVRAGNPTVWVENNGKIAIEALEWVSFVHTDGDKVTYMKPEGVLIELADALIRIADFAGNLKLDVTHWNNVDGDFQYADNEQDFYFRVIEIIGSQISIDLKLQLLFQDIIRYCRHYNWDLGKALEIKAEYNTHRSHRHGGKKF